MLYCNPVKHCVIIIDCPVNIIHEQGRGIALAFPGSGGHRRSIGHVREEERNDRIYSAQ